VRLKSFFILLTAPRPPAESQNTQKSANARADNRIFFEETGRTLSDSQAQVMLASVKKVHSDLSRLTLTTAEASNAQFIRLANRAYMNVASGAFNYTSAIKQATDELAKEGLFAGSKRRNLKDFASL